MQANVIKTALGLLAAAGLTLAAANAQADWPDRSDPPHPRTLHDRFSLMHAEQINARQDRQMARIQTGWRTGDLTRGEFRMLMRQQHEIRAMERHFLADGVLDGREFRRLDAALDEAGRSIRWERHDRLARDYREYHPRYN